VRLLKRGIRKVMPSKSYRQCHAIGCHKLTKDKYCPAHTIEEDKQRKDMHKEYKKNRTDDKEQSFYVSKEWRMLRAHHVQSNPLCYECIQESMNNPRHRISPVDVVDHIIEIKDDWSKRLDPNNLMSLCMSHHNSKTREEAKKRQGNR
jgi:5-methylcytosine-specific restriction enzyme A